MPCGVGFVAAEEVARIIALARRAIDFLQGDATGWILNIQGQVDAQSFTGTCMCEVGGDDASEESGPIREVSLSWVFRPSTRSWGVKSVPALPSLFWAAQWALSAFLTILVFPPAPWPLRP